LTLRRAVVDIGTNSTRLFIADVRDGRIGDVVQRRTEITRLGAGVDAGGRLSEEAMARVYAVLDDYRVLIDRARASDAVAVLTSAVRDAANGAEFAQTVCDRWAIQPHILSGDVEARLTFLGATSERDPGDLTPTLVIDIGGGSTEFVIGSGHEVAFHVSNQAGVVRQTERHLHSDPPVAAERDALARDVRAILGLGVPASVRGGVAHAIAVAGTAT
jgi:exopolyphosphatase/guanosine-5'-triphosphate,3'-diphosphate pyrophosphatase